jgi:enoyl-CoA hydratase
VEQEGQASAGGFAVKRWETLRVEGDGPVRQLVLERPRVHNAINAQVLAELIDASGSLDASPDCRVVILRGEGPSFSSGADLKEGLTHGGTVKQRVLRSRLGSRVIEVLGGLRPVTIAAVHGHAIGGGACLAAACDFRIAAAGARLSVREASLGLNLSWHSVPNFVHLVGATRAKEMIMFGETYDAETLRSFGFYGEVVPEERLLQAALALAEKVVRQPPLPVEMTKASVNALVKALDHALHHLDPYALAFTAGGRDAAAAREAFFGGEPPDWEYD